MLKGNRPAGNKGGISFNFFIAWLIGEKFNSDVLSLFKRRFLKFKIYDNEKVLDNHIFFTRITGHECTNGITL